MKEFSHFQVVLQNLVGSVANELAFTSGFRQRVSTLGGAELAEALIGGWWANPKASRAELAQLVGVSKQALDQSLSEKAAGFLQDLLGWGLSQLCAATPCEVELLKRFNGVYVFDSSVVSLPAELAPIWPGCGSTKADGASAAGLKLHVGLELRSGALIGPEFSSARIHDRRGPHQNLVLPVQALRLTDLGYFKLKRFEQIAKAEKGYFISKVQCATQILNSQGEALPLGEWLAEQARDQLDQEVVIGAAQRLRCRLVAFRVNETIVSKRHRKFKEQVAKRQRPTSAEQMRLSYWLVYLTNIPSELASGEEITVLYRLRWQIELLFKLWKSEGGLSEWHSKKPWACLCEFYAKLLIQLLQHHLLVRTGWQQEARSLVKASRIIRQHVRGLLKHLWQGTAFLEGLKDLEEDLGGKGLSLEGSGRRPSSQQIMLKPPSLSLGRRLEADQSVPTLSSKPLFQ